MATERIAEELLPAAPLRQIVYENDGKAPKRKLPKKLLRPVLVTTEYKGVFFGYAAKTDGDVINLKRARNCIYWGASVKGFLGLAANGPDQSCRIGPPVDVQLRKITCVAEVTEDAVDKWEAAPWWS